MKYLLLNGSPHKGNTWKLVELAAAQIKKSDLESEFEEIHLAEENLLFCVGCSNCFRLGHEMCPHSKIMSRILAAMERADGIIVASTTFNMRETGMLKNLFDHMGYMLHRPHFFTKKTLILNTVGGVGGGSTIKSIAGTLRGIGFNKCYTLSVMSASWNAYNPSQGTVHKVEKLADKFSKDVISKKIHFQKTEVLIPYNLFRGMSKVYAPGQEYATKDGNYYIKPERRKRVYDLQVPLLPFQRLVGGIFGLIGKLGGKFMVVTYRK